MTARGADKAAKSESSLPPVITDLQAGALITKYCVECHGDKQQEAELSLQWLLSKPDGLAGAPTVLEDVLITVEDGDMPPRKAERKPTDAEREQLVAWADHKLKVLAERHRDDPGRIVMPRLTPAQYRNIIRDLSGAVVRDAAKYLPNEGGAGEGFANVGEAQGMSTPIFEKYLATAKHVLRHVRANPESGLIWRDVPREAVAEPADARFEAVNDIIAWYGARQTYWGFEHREELKRRYGLDHGMYLEAAWRYRYRAELGKSDMSFDDAAAATAPELSGQVLAKWWAVLHQDDPSEHAAGVINAWNDLPKPGTDEAKQIRQRCKAIENWKEQVDEKTRPIGYAPDYEISLRTEKDREKVRAAAKQGRWPFVIEIGDATELYLIVTDYADGNGDDYYSWHKGEFEFADGSKKDWRQVTQVKDLEGRPVKWGYHPKDMGRGDSSVGLHAPKTYKLDVPKGASVFRVEVVITDEGHKQSSAQALVLREPLPEKHRKKHPTRYVFGGPKSVKVNKPVASFEQFEREIRRTNIPGANETKVGLNAERNVLADWTLTDVRYIGGPWDHQGADKEQPLSPYYLTAVEARRIATTEERDELRMLHRRLATIVQKPHQDALALLKESGWEKGREGATPPEQLLASLSDEQRKRYDALRAEMTELETDYESTARALLNDFATRAWRRPVRDEELATLMRLYGEARGRGFSFDAAIKGPLLTVLVSPHFVYSHPIDATPDEARDVKDGVIALNSYELATRLSLFLWASSPDERLLELAAADKLRDPATLAAEARRMLRDDRARSLATDFAGQMWRFGDFESYTGPDEERFKAFTPALRQAMYDEVVAFLDDAFRNDRPLTGLINADYTFVNDDLAELYGIGGVDGEAMRRVDAPKERGGLAGMALFLTRTSLPLRTSAVQRGVWVMEDILGRHLPDPPAGVDPISADETNDKGQTIAEQLKIHRADPTCASCHDKIDPLGVSLEGFDPIGRARSTLRNGEPIAASAESHDGVMLEGYGGLRRYLMQRRDEVFAHFNRKLLGYALGRAVGPGDKALLSRMHESLNESDHRFSTLVEAVVTSRQFRYRRANVNGAE